MKKEASDVTLAYVIDGVEYVYDIETINVYVDPKTMVPYMMEVVGEPMEMSIGTFGVEKPADKTDTLIDKLEQLIDVKLALALDKSHPQYIYDESTQGWTLLEESIEQMRRGEGKVVRPNPHSNE